MFFSLFLLYHPLLFLVRLSPFLHFVFLLSHFSLSLSVSFSFFLSFLFLPDTESHSLIIIIFTVFIQDLPLLFLSFSTVFLHFYTVLICVHCFAQLFQCFYIFLFRLFSFTHYPPWVDTSTSNIAAMWNCYFLPNCGQNTFVDNLLFFLLGKKRFFFLQK